MTRHVIAAILMLSLLGAASPSDESARLEYEVTAVKRKLFHIVPDGEHQLQLGDRSYSGDELRTGSRSSADFAVPARAATFHIGSKTEFRLAHGQPGVLLEIDRGSVRAIFGPLSADDEGERLIATPSAVLAVRGTEYGIEVQKDGDTSLTVFEGEVEIRTFDKPGTILRVPAGQATRIRRGRQPSAPWTHGVSPHDWDRGRRMESPAQGQRQQQPGTPESGRSNSGGSRGQSSQGGSNRRGG